MNSSTWVAFDLVFGYLRKGNLLFFRINHKKENPSTKAKL